MESSSSNAVIHFKGKKIELPLIEGAEGECALDIRTLRSEVGCITFDNGLSNTGTCTSNITFVDGEKGICRYRGYNVVDLAEKCTFVEVAYLLIHGKLPIKDEIHTWSDYLNEHSMIHEDMQNFFTGLPPNSHPMAILSSMVTALSSFYPHIMAGDPNFDITAARLISKVRTIAAYSYKKSRGERVVHPRWDLSYCANFLNMMFESPVQEYAINDNVVRALNQLLVLHADHEQNCSTSAVRMVASSGVNLYAAVSSGISALWGPYHGGANQAVIEMLNYILADGGNIKGYIEKVKDKTNKIRLMGFGHAVYKTYDPRAIMTKKIADNLLSTFSIKDPILDLAMELEEAALHDAYFIDRKLYPNVDFYSGIIYRAMGIPTNMMTVMFAIGRLPGWIAHWRETVENKDWKIWRPRQIYTGPLERDVLSIDKRDCQVF